MKIYKSKRFKKWSIEEKLSDKKLIKAVEEIENGLYEADLGCGLFKKRIAGEGMGKRGGYRTLLAFKKQNRSFFVYGFSKNEKSNIDYDELSAYKILAKKFILLSENEVKKLLEMGELVEVIK